jgi:glycosyltransferase involved in cell wall biosynthesis
MAYERPTVSIIVPAYNVAKTIRQTLDSLIHQTFQDIEIIVVDDGATDDTPLIIKSYKDSRMRIVRQVNRGLAGARNTGIQLSMGKYIAFCDSDDIWEAEKIELHVQHLESDSNIGISFSGSSLIDENGNFLRTIQSPKLKNISASDIFKRNPIGNGSVAVIRRATLDAIAYRPANEHQRDWWFDETLRQSEDIDAWIRIALATDWKIEGIPGLLTRYRVQAGGLSANLEKQYETWIKMREKVASTAPRFFELHGAAAESYQLRYLARRAFFSGDGANASKLSRRAMSVSFTPIFEEPFKTIATWLASETLNLLRFYPKLRAKFNKNLSQKV